MTVRVSKPAFNIREKLSELDRPVGTHGSQLMRSNDGAESFNLVSAGRKNKIINGAMQISQRRGSSSHTDSNGFHTDRFRTQVAGMDQLVQTYQQVSDGPPGFSNSLKITTTTAETSIDSSSEYLAVYQKMEGQNLQDFAYGTTSAKTITVSFYVKSSITGQFSYTIYRNESTDRAINKFYTINNANTWERKTITIEGDTVAAISNGNGDQWWNVWILAASPNYMSAETAVWANYASGTNWAGFHKQNGVITTLNATWQITGVQIEVGENATEYEHRSIGEEIDLCRRYYSIFHPTGQEQVYIENSGVASHSFVNFPIPYGMRTEPSVTLGGTWTGHGIVSGRSISAVAVQTVDNGGNAGTTHVGSMGRVSCRVTRDSSGTYTSGQIAHTDGWDDGVAWLAYDAEI